MRTPTRNTRKSRADEEPQAPEREPEAAEREALRPRRERLPTIAIVGRPNVGKSTLFNRIAGGRRALVHDTPGVTRDRRIERAEWGGRAFLLADTGGFDVAVEDPLYEDVVEQARAAMQEADLLIHLTAVGEEENPAEIELVRELRRAKKPVLVAVNKSDNPAAEHEAQQFFRYGHGEIHPISALHGRGVADLLDAAVARLDAEGIAGREVESGGIALAIVGRQNVGKSSLLNRILGSGRVIVSPLAGTTRDAVDTTFRTPEGDLFTLIDTAGIRRRGKVERGIEKISVLSSILALERADVAAIVIDGAMGVTAQDAHVAGYCVDAGCACMIVVNKWDLAPKDHKTADEYTKILEREWSFLRYAPVVYVSALTGQRVPRVLEIAKKIHANAGRRIPTPELNEKLKAWVGMNPPPMRRNRQLKFKYAAQTGVHPPTFAVFVNDATLVHFSYQRYLSNRLYEEYDFEGTPLRMHFKSTKREAAEGEEDASAPKQRPRKKAKR